MLETGIKNELEYAVRAEDLDVAVGCGEHGMLAMSTLTALMEKTAEESVRDKVEEGYGTIGAAMNIIYVTPVPKEVLVRCESELIEIDGQILKFRIKVSDAAGLVGEGEHKRIIVDNIQFMAKKEKHMDELYKCI